MKCLPRHTAISVRDLETVGRTKVNYFFVKDPDGVWVEFIKDDRYN